MIDFFMVIFIADTTGFSLFLLAFNLYSYQTEEWWSPIICFVVVGFCLMIAFTFWKRYFASVKSMPWEPIRNRTVFSTFSMFVSLDLAWYIWESFFYCLLQFMSNQTVTEATYISNNYTTGSCFWCLIFGAILRYNGRLEWWAICLALL